MNKHHIFDGVGRIDKITAMFEVWLDPDLFPFPKMKVKITKDATQNFTAIPNVFRVETETGFPEYICGLGKSEEDALKDLLTRFVSDVQEHSTHGQLSNSDFEWSAPEDF